VENSLLSVAAADMGRHYGLAGGDRVAGGTDPTYFRGPKAA